ncbi:hypothetical protein BC938DRAFT_484165 [Jimgerdemannia flammicorona]|uniref:Uncharacterized protein n=1 Tax=Jimgerdemannia flammicorona TaxID=994334 RepID=A0A433QVE9_9FUNG|nr:hypothetical protein BC938DRAFT_484165 [Jimgerdemannia flammicorona]
MEILPSADAYGNDLIVSVFYTFYTPQPSPEYASILSLYFKKIMIEVGPALPLNGGTYNCILNTTLKLFEAVAAF